MQKIAGVDSDKKRFSTDDYRGKVLLLDFWVDWCPHCRVMYPLERKLVEQYENRPFAILGINCDKKGRLDDLIESQKVTWRNFVDGEHGPIANAWRIESYPNVYLVDHTGVIRHKRLQSDDFERAIAALVKEAEEAEGSKSIYELREYVDSKGRKAKLRFVSREGDQCVFEREDGSKASTPISNLSQSDQDFLSKAEKIRKP